MQPHRRTVKGEGGRRRRTKNASRARSPQKVNSVWCSTSRADQPDIDPTARVDVTAFRPDAERSWGWCVRIRAIHDGPITRITATARPGKQNPAGPSRPEITVRHVTRATKTRRKRKQRYPAAQRRACRRKRRRRCRTSLRYPNTPATALFRRSHGNGTAPLRHSSSCRGGFDQGLLELFQRTAFDLRTRCLGNPQMMPEAHRAWSGRPLRRRALRMRPVRASLSTSQEIAQPAATALASMTSWTVRSGSAASSTRKIHPLRTWRLRNRGNRRFSEVSPPDSRTFHRATS